MNISKKITQLILDENGGEIVEYAVVIGVLVAGIIAIMQGILGNVVILFGAMETATDSTL